MPKVTSNEGKPYAEIGTLLRNLRLRRGLSQFELASAAGINNSYLSRIENGERRPSPKILKRFLNNELSAKDAARMMNEQVRALDD